MLEDSRKIISKVLAANSMRMARNNEKVFSRMENSTLKDAHSIRMELFRMKEDFSKDNATEKVLSSPSEEFLSVLVNTRKGKSTGDSLGSMRIDKSHSKDSQGTIREKAMLSNSIRMESHRSKERTRKGKKYQVLSTMRVASKHSKVFMKTMKKNESTT